MLSRNEHVELEQFRAQAETNRLLGKYLLVVMVVALVTFFGAAYMADAVRSTGLGFQVDVAKMVRHYSKK